MRESTYSGGCEFQLKNFYVSFQTGNRHAAKIKHPEKTWQGHNPKTAGTRKPAEFGFSLSLSFRRDRVFTALFDSFQMPGRYTPERFCHRAHAAAGSSRHR
jgi:hypothetical protein